MEKEQHLRIDKYLWAIRIFKTRSLASAACEGGKVKWNGNPVKASKQVHVGEQYEIKLPERKWKIEVSGLLEQRKAFAEAVHFYLDITSEEDKAFNKQQASSFYTGKRQSKIGRPTKKDRRDLEGFNDF
jgi:ribosome-associated heat shock protein Hsp15